MRKTSSPTRSLSLNVRIPLASRGPTVRPLGRCAVLLSKRVPARGAPHALLTPASPDGFGSVLTRSEWKGVIDFAQAANAKLVTSFAISAGVRDPSGVWTPDQARELLAYTKSVGGDIAAGVLGRQHAAQPRVGPLDRIQGRVDDRPK